MQRGVIQQLLSDCIEAIEISPIDRPPPYLFREATLAPSLCFSIFPFSYPCIFWTQILTLMTWQHFNKRFRTVNISRGVAGRRNPSPEEAKPRVLLLPLSVDTYFRDISIARVTMSVNVKKKMPGWLEGNSGKHESLGAGGKCGGIRFMLHYSWASA